MCEIYAGAASGVDVRLLSIHLECVTVSVLCRSSEEKNFQAKYSHNGSMGTEGQSVCLATVLQVVQYHKMPEPSRLRPKPRTGPSRPRPQIFVLEAEARRR
jgi:hypothetical protein